MSTSPDAWASTLLDATTDIIQIFDKDGRYAFINNAGRRLFAKHGIDAGAMIGKKVFEDVFAASAASPPAMAVRRALVEREASEFEYQYPAWNLWFWAHYYPIANGAVAVVTQDITARKVAELKLSESQAQLKVITDSVPALISYVDRNLSYRFVNSAYTEWFGLGADAIIGRTMQEVLGEQAWAVVGPRVRAALAGDAVEFEAEAPYAHGGARWIHASYTPHRHPTEGVVGIVIMVADITARRHAEDALRDADRRKDEFLAILAHELRNPLAPIRTGLEVLKLGSDKPDVVGRIRPMLDRQVSHMVRLIDDLLDVSRITSGKIELQRHYVPLAELVGNAVDANAAALDARNHALQVDLPEWPVLVEADATRLAQTIGNVLGNAAKFTDPGGRIDVSVAVEGGDAVTRIVDSGIGMSPEMLERVFELFVQGDHGDRPHAGLGIGLALVRRLVEMLGGRVTAHSAGPGLGSAFEIRLPLTVSVAAELPVAAAAREPLLRGTCRRILVVDDNVDAAEALTMLLRLAGHDVHTAHDGHAALELAGRWLPEVVFLDLGMPRLDGFGTAAELRRRHGARLALVALTGWGQERDREATARAGFDAHLVKPVAEADLHRVLTSAVARVGA